MVSETMLCVTSRSYKLIMTKTLITLNLAADTTTEEEKNVKTDTRSVIKS